MSGTNFGGSCQGLEQYVVPIPTIQVSSRTQFVGNGVTNQYTITWPYISASHVNVLVGGVIIGTQLWSFVNSTTVQLNTSPANGLLVELRRVTPQSSLVTFTNGAVLTADDLNLATLQNLYLIQEFNDLYTAGLNGAMTQVAGYAGPVMVTPAEMVAAVADQVLNSTLVTSLNTRINDIDQNATAILNNAIAVDNINGIIDSLVGVGGVGTIIAAEQASRIAGDTALASQLTLLGAVNLTQTAFVLDTSHTYVDASTSLATRLAGIDAYNASNAAAVVTETTARVSGDSANASSITTLTSTVNSNTASIATNATTVSGLSAQYTVKVDVNGRVSGYGLASTATTAGATSAFVVIANKFSIVDPGSTGSTPIVPFSVSGGVVYIQNVVIDGALIQNATITNAAIANLTIGTPQIANNAVTNIVNSTLSALVNGSATGTTASPATSVSLDSLSITTTTNSPVHVVCTTMPTGTGDAVNASTTGFQVNYTIWRNGANINAPTAFFTHSNTNWTAGSTIKTPPVTFDFVDPAPGVGTQTYSLRVSVTPTGTGGSITAHRDSICWNLKELKK